MDPTWNPPRCGILVPSHGICIEVVCVSQCLHARQLHPLIPICYPLFLAPTLILHIHAFVAHCPFSCCILTLDPIRRGLWESLRLGPAPSLNPDFVHYGPLVHVVTPDYTACGAAVLAILGGVAGALGALFMMYLYAAFPDLRNTHRTIILFLSMCDLGQALQFCAIALSVVAGTWHETYLWVIPLCNHLLLLPCSIWSVAVLFHVCRVYDSVIEAQKSRWRKPSVRFPLPGGWSFFHLLACGLPTMMLAYLSFASYLSSPSNDCLEVWRIGQPSKAQDILPWLLEKRAFDVFYSYSIPLVLAFVVMGLLYHQTQARTHRIRDLHAHFELNE